MDDETTNYAAFRNWFLDVLRNWRGNDLSVHDVVQLDKSLMSLGAFIQRNDGRVS